MSRLNILVLGLKDNFDVKFLLKELKSLGIRDYLMLFVLVLTQIGTYIFTGQYDIMSTLTLLVGVLTIISLILVNQGKLSNYTFGIFATLFWLIVAVKAHLIGDVFSQVYYLVMQLVGIYVWKKDMLNTNNDYVKPKKLTLGKAIISIVAFVVLYVLVVVTSHKLGGQQIYLDATLLPLAIVSQVLMTYGYRSQWLGWISINLINVVIWYNAFMSMGDSVLGMLVLQVAMLINSFYGTYLWFSKK